MWEHDRQGVNAELKQERELHQAEIGRRASQRLAQRTALEKQMSEKDKTVCPTATKQQTQC